eukprot:scaffold171658_cov37-Tisochrysis_lutea.AAC.1
MEKRGNVECEVAAELGLAVCSAARVSKVRLGLAWSGPQPGHSRTAGSGWEGEAIVDRGGGGGELELAVGLS